MGLGAAAITLGAYGDDALRRLELDTVDTRFAIRGPQSPPRDLVIVRIDDETFSSLQQRWPFPRSFHARVMRRISKDQPAVIAFDVQFTEETTPAEDNALIRAVAAAGGKVVLAASAVENGRTNIFGGDSVLRRTHARAGNVGLPTDPGGVLRRLPYSVDGLKSFAVVAAEIATSRPIERSEFGGDTAWIDFHGPPGTIPAISYWRVLEGRVKPGFFAGKVVVVGAFAPTLQDLHATSASTDEPMAGPEIEANAISTVLAGFPMRNASRAAGVALILLLGLLVPVLTLGVRMSFALLLGLAVGAAYLVTTQVAFNGGVILPVVYPIGALLASASAALGARYVAAALDARAVRLDRSGQYAVGVEVGGYTIERQVGRGGGGTVYLASDRILRRKVALKVLSAEFAEDAVFRERFLYESRLAAALDHAHVVPIYAAGDDDGRLFLAMKFVPGSLATLLQRDRTLEFQRALEILEQVGDALDTAHSLGLVHRDVTPSNILLEPRSSHGLPDRAYLADFGVALEGGTSTHEVAGKAEYLAPEQIRGESIDGRVDQYSLGCVLFECLAGAPPFVGATEVAVIGGHLSGQVPSIHHRRPDLPEALDAVFGRALAKKQEDRYENCGEFMTAARSATRADASAPA